MNLCQPSAIGRRDARAGARDRSVRASVRRFASAGATLLALAVAAANLAAAAQGPIDVEELARYRLTPGVFTRYVAASRRIGDVAKEDAALARAPLFTREVVQSGDAAAAANGLASRLQGHPEVAAALASAKITPREFATFTIALVAARLAHGFLDSGVLRRVPDGAPASNVEFVARNESEILETLALLGIAD